MKKLGIIVLSILVLTSTSCEDGKLKLFGGSGDKDKQIASLERENQKLREELDEIEEEHASEITSIRSDYEQRLADLQKQIEAGKIDEFNAYFVIAGSFKNRVYAEEYAATIKELGYEGKIVDGPNNFNLVTYASFETLSASIASMREARNGLSPEAWVYFRN